MDDRDVEHVFEPMPEDMLAEIRGSTAHWPSSGSGPARVESSFGYVDMAEPDSGIVRVRIVYYDQSVMCEQQARELWPRLWQQRRDEAPEQVAAQQHGQLLEQYETDLAGVPNWWSWWQMDEQRVQRISEELDTGIGSSPHSTRSST